MSDAHTKAPATPLNGFLGSVTHLLVTLAEMAFTRMELVLLELQEGVEGMVGLLLWSFVAVFAALSGLFLGALALIFAFWDTHRVLVSVLVMSAFLAIALAATLVVLAKLRARRSMFAASLAEFARDRQLLKARP